MRRSPLAHSFLPKKDKLKGRHYNQALARILALLEHLTAPGQQISRKVCPLLLPPTPACSACLPRADQPHAHNKTCPFLC